MKPLEIKTYPDNILRKKCEPIEKITEGERELFEKMLFTMRYSYGIGLAAPQIGRSIALAVIDPRPLQEDAKPLVILNPTLVEQRGECSFEEGCLSIPDVRQDVVRPESIVVTGLDLEGNPTSIETGGLLARILQHEIDHLNGVLFTDRLGSVQRQMIQAQLDALGDARERDEA